MADAAVKKPRSIVELVIVRGGILVMLVLVALQALAWWNFSQTKGPILVAMKEANDGPVELSETRVKELVKGSPSHEVWQRQGDNRVWVREDSASTGNTGDQYAPSPDEQRAHRVDTYVWKGLFKPYVLRLYYGVKRKDEDQIAIHLDYGTHVPDESLMPTSDAAPNPAVNGGETVPAATTDGGTEKKADATEKPADADAKKDAKTE